MLAFFISLLYVFNVMERTETARDDATANALS